MAGVPGTRCHIILGHQTRHDGVEQVQELTVSPLERSAAPGESPRRQVTVGGGDWKEREGAGEVKSGQNETTTRNWRYLRAR